jgi:hypothetical protein
LITPNRYCEERSDEAIQNSKCSGRSHWIASLRSQ